MIIQPAFIGDVILATGLIEKLREKHPEAPIDFLVRKGNESLLHGHPYLRNLLVWDKKKGKIKNLVKLAVEVRKKQYSHVINVHRFASSGFVTAWSGAKNRIGFNKNPLSFLYTHRVKHELNGIHETERNQQLIESFASGRASRPKLYPSVADVQAVKDYTKQPYVCIAPTSVWFTKQYPKEKWVELLRNMDSSFAIFLLGASADRFICDEIIERSGRLNVTNLAGKLSFLQSAALMRDARVNFVNDSAPMHIASSMNAPVAAIYCSTVSSFGFGPLSEKSWIVETDEKLECRPCGLHGHKRCPQSHFQCATSISTEKLLNCLGT